jgi:hypothetical protein
VVDQLTEYESAQVAEIAAWKAEQPGAVSKALQGIRAPLGRIVGRVVPGSMVRTIAEKAEVLVEAHDGVREIAREAGVDDVGELRYRPLQECDRLAAAVSARAQRMALAEGAAAGIGGIVTELGNIPVLIAAAERAVRRIGHCYGYPLDTEAERRFVLGVLELSTVDDPARRRRLRERLVVPAATSGAGSHGPSLNGVKKEVVNELLLEAVPLLGDVASVALDYAFMRRVDLTARRVFQERWLRDLGKVAEIPPADPAPGRQTHTLRAACDLVSEAVYLGGYGAGFVVTAPVALAAALASRLPAPVVRGAAAGARDAAVSADQFAAGWQSLSEPDTLPSPNPA